MADYLLSAANVKWLGMECPNVELESLKIVKIKFVLHNHIRVTERFKCQIQKHSYLVEQSCSQAFPIFWGSIWQNMIRVQFCIQYLEGSPENFTVEQVLTIHVRFCV